MFNAHLIDCPPHAQVYYPKDSALQETTEKVSRVFDITLAAAE